MWAGTIVFWLLCPEWHCGQMPVYTRHLAGVAVAEQIVATKGHLLHSNSNSDTNGIQQVCAHFYGTRSTCVTSRKRWSWWPPLAPEAVIISAHLSGSKNSVWNSFAKSVYLKAGSFSGWTQRLQRTFQTATRTSTTHCAGWSQGLRRPPSGRKSWSSPHRTNRAGVWHPDWSRLVCNALWVQVQSTGEELH